VRLVWLVIPLVLFGVIGISESFAESEEQYCDEGLVLIQKISKSSLACVKLHTAEKLIERKWAVKVIETPPVLLETDKNIYKKGDMIEVTITNQINEQFHYSVGLFDPKGKPFVDCLVRAQVIPSIHANDVSFAHLELSKDCRNEPTLPGKYVVFFYSEFGNAIRSVIVEESSHYDNVDFSKTIVDDGPLNHTVLAGIPVALYSSLEYPEFIKIGDEFDVTVKWTFTEYDEEGNIEHQYSPINSLTKEIFDKAFLQIKIPKNIEMITDVSDWEETIKIHHDTSYNFDNALTTYSKTIPFDYTNPMHEQTYRFKLAEPFFPPFDYMKFGGLGFGKIIYHQDGSLISPQLDTASINTLQSAITVERLGIDDPQYPEVSSSDINWTRASEIVPKAINTPTDPDESQTQEIRDFYVNVLKRNPTNDELLNTDVSQTWIDSFFKKYPELINKSFTTEKILSSYDEELANKKVGYDVLLASSLEPFEDDGREYRYMILEHYPAPTPYFDMIKYGWIDTTGFETNEYGVVTYLDESHEKYALNLEEGFYREDWLPDYIPNGQKLLVSQTGYSTYEKNELINEKYSASYNFVPIHFVVDEKTTSYDLEHNMGFRISVYYDSWQVEIEDILEERKERHAGKSANYGGYKTMIRDGEMVILFEGGYTGRHYENSIYWIFDDNYSISVRSHYYTLDELIPIFESIMNE